MAPTPKRVQRIIRGTYSNKQQKVIPFWLAQTKKKLFLQARLRAKHEHTMRDTCVSEGSLTYSLVSHTLYHDAPPQLRQPPLPSL